MTKTHSVRSNKQPYSEGACLKTCLPLIPANSIKPLTGYTGYNTVLTLESVDEWVQSTTPQTSTGKGSPAKVLQTCPIFRGTQQMDICLNRLKNSI